MLDQEEEDDFVVADGRGYQQRTRQEKGDFKTALSLLLYFAAP